MYCYSTRIYTPLCLTSRRLEAICSVAVRSAHVGTMNRFPGSKFLQHTPRDATSPRLGRQKPLSTLIGALIARLHRSVLSIAGKEHANQRRRTFVRKASQNIKDFTSGNL